MPYRFVLFGIFLTIVLCLAMPSDTLAQNAGSQQGGFVPLTKDAKFDNFNALFGISGSTGGVNDLGTFVNGAFRAALSLGAILAVMRIAWGGYQYMTSEVQGTKGHAREILGDAMIGILLLLSMWLILYQINPNLLTIKLPGGLTPNAPKTYNETPYN